MPMGEFLATHFDSETFRSLFSAAPRKDDDIGACKAAYNNTHEVLQQYFIAGATADDVVRGRAELVESIIYAAWQRYGLGSFPMAIAAVGGFGRRELHPFSDVDIAVLVSAAPEGEQRRAWERFHAYLWDIGLEVGSSVRTIAASIETARDDLTVMTNLLEGHFIAGAQALWKQLQAQLDTHDIWPTAKFFQAKLAEQHARHQRFNDAFQQLEPNVKESPGGLRDLHAISWVTQRHFGTSQFRALLDRNFLTHNEFVALTRIRDHLWRIRCALHFTARRKEDRLLFDHQKHIAALFGHSDSDGNRAVETFMKHYYRDVRELSVLNEILLGLFEEALLHDDRELKPRALNRRFAMRGDYIEAVDSQVFERTPPALLEVFLLLQQNPGAKGVRASTLRLIREHLYLIDDRTRADIRARSLFMEIMREPRRVGHELQRMHRYGVLSAYLPVFARVEGLMQFDLFHVHTVDEHCLFVMRNMRRFSYPREGADQTPLIREVIERIPKPEVLYLAGLLHDIAKGSGRDHSEAGADVAQEFCQRHGLSDYDAAMICWLVRNHLLMSATAQRQDIYDLNVVQAFAAAVGSQERLDYLFLLTIADIRGTNPELWTSWKESLFNELLLATRRVLGSDSETILDRGQRVQSLKDAAQQLITGADTDPDALAAFWDTLSASYFLRHRPFEIAWHAQVVLASAPGDFPLVAINNFEMRGSTAVFIYTRDMDDLFAISTATLDRLRLDVQDARIYTSEAGITLDTYMVLDAETKELVLDDMRFDIIREKLRAALRAGEIPPRRVPLGAARRLQHFSIPTEVSFSLSQNADRTVMEVVATDRPGLLSDIGEAMKACHVRLHDARIATFGERAEDYFYITDLNNAPLSTAQRQTELRAAIIHYVGKE